MKAVPVTTLQELVESGAVQLTRGKIISKRDIAACPGNFPIYSSAKDNDGKFGEYGKFLFDEELITWSVDGGGRLFHRPKHKFSVTNVGGVLRIQDRSILDYRYLYFVLTLRHSEISFDWVRKAHPSVIKKLYQNIPLPPLAEQRRIVGILDEAFEGLATAKANAEQNLQNARALFESHLYSVFGTPKKTWPTKSLGDVCEYLNGKAHEQCIERDGKFIVINSKFISSDGDVCKRSNEALLLLRPGDIAMVLSDVPNGKALAKCFLVDEANTYTLNQRICVIRSNVFHTKFLFYQLNRNRHFLAFDNGENQTNMRLNQMLSCPLFVPSRSEQETIADILEQMSEETQRLESLYQRKLAALDELKKSLLHRAFSGEL